MKLVNFFENSKPGSGFQEPSESGCLGKQIKKGKSKKKVSETDTVDEHIKGGLDSYYELTKAKRLAKADGHDYDELPEYHRGKDQPHKEKYKALAKEVSEDIHIDEMDMPDISDDMIGTPDNHYDDEQRKEAYVDMINAIDDCRHDWQRDSVIDGICPECSGSSCMDGDDENGEDSCYGWGNFGCDGGEINQNDDGLPNWAEIIKHDKRKAERQSAEDNYPGDDAVIQQAAKMMPNMDDPRMIVQQIRADYPTLGRAKASDLAGKAKQIAFPDGATEGRIEDTFGTKTIDKHDKPEKDKKKKDEDVELIKKLSGIKSVDENLKDLERLDLQGYKGLDGKIYKFYPKEGPRQTKPGTDLESPTGKPIGMFRADDGTKALPPIVDPKQPSVFKQGTKIGNDLMKQRIKVRDKTAPGNPRVKKEKPGFFGSLFNDIHEDSESDASESAVAKMIAKALGDENRWTEMSAAELYAELESQNSEMADMVKDVAKMIYGVQLAEGKTKYHDSSECGCKCGKPVCAACGRPHRPEDIKEAERPYTNSNHSQNKDKKPFGAGAHTKPEGGNPQVCDCITSSGAVPNCPKCGGTGQTTSPIRNDPQGTLESEEGAEDFYTKLTSLIHDEEAYAKACGMSMKKLDHEMGEISRDLNLHMDDDREAIIMRHAEDQEEKFKNKVKEEITLEDNQDFHEEFGVLGYSEDEEHTFEAEYQGRTVKLNKPTRGDVKKFKVYVKDPKTGNVKKVNFGHGGTSAKRKTMRIRKSNPKARKSFRARHNCSNPGPKTKARYWSCRKW